MASGMLLINGSSLPYQLIDHALQWANEHEASLQVLIIYNGERDAEGYLFPSDIENAGQTVSEEEGEYDLNRLIQTNMHYIEKQARRLEVRLKGTVLRDPDEEQIVEAIHDNVILFADPKSFDGGDDYSRTAYTFDQIRQWAGAALYEPTENQ